MEEWKDIKGYEGLYQISNYGRVKSLNYDHTGKEQILKLPKSQKGHLYVCLYKNEKRNVFEVHRLVALSFLDKNNFKYCEYEDLSKIDLDDLQVNHIDKDKTNNDVDNLEWCTCKYNYRHKRKKVYKKVLCIETGVIYDSVKEAAEINNLFSSNISTCAKNQNKTAGGYHWKYIDEE